MDTQPLAPVPRRFVYRAAEPTPNHPMRRSSDRPPHSAATAIAFCPRMTTFKVRVYYKLN
jgi:hypothetical protein